MADSYPILAALMTGFISGLLLSIPVGPVNLTIMNEGARRGFKWAALIGVGASLMEVIYCALAFTGFASIFNEGIWKYIMELVSFLFMLGLGLKFLLIKTLPTHGKEGRFEKRLHPTSAFATGFVRVMANPGVFLFWIFLGIYFINHTWVMPTWSSKGACVAGVAVGTSVWFFGLSYAVSLGHRNFTNKTLLRMERGSGIGLLGLALIHGVQILWEMHKHKI
jgi:threonine/homoserine/homoserine lactone efflux protein